MYGPCLDLDSNQPTIKISFRDKCGHLNTDEVLDDAEFLLLLVRCTNGTMVMLFLKVVTCWVYILRYLQVKLNHSWGFL